MKSHVAFHWPWSALLTAALAGCGAPQPPPSPTPLVGGPTIIPVCPAKGMPFMYSATLTKPEALLCDTPGSSRDFETSPTYGSLNLAAWLANKDVDAMSWGLDWIPTDRERAYWQLLPLAPGGTSGPAWEGWGAILYGDSTDIYAYAWGDPNKLAGLLLSPGHHLLHHVTDLDIVPPIDAIDFNGWVFSGAPSTLCYAPFPPPAEGYDPTFVYSIPGPPSGGTTEANSGATLFGVKAVEQSAGWGWVGFTVAAPAALGLELTDEIETLAFDRRQGLLMYSLATPPEISTTKFMVMRVTVVPNGEQFSLKKEAPPKELEISPGVTFSASGPSVGKPSTACSIDPSKFRWDGLRGSSEKDAEPKEAQAKR